MLDEIYHETSKIIYRNGDLKLLRITFPRFVLLFRPMTPERLHCLRAGIPSEILELGTISPRDCRVTFHLGSTDRAIESPGVLRADRITVGIQAKTESRKWNLVASGPSTSGRNDTSGFGALYRRSRAAPREGNMADEDEASTQLWLKIGLAPAIPTAQRAGYRSILLRAFIEGALHVDSYSPRPRSLCSRKSPD